MKKVLLLIAVVSLFSITDGFAQFNSINDNCTQANRLCAGLEPIRGRTTIGRTSEATPGFCGTESKSVWFFMETYIPGGSATVTIAGIDSSCGLEAQIFIGNCGALVPLDAACPSPSYGTAGPGGSITLSLAGTVAGQRYYIMVNTPTGCQGELFNISATTPDDGILGVPVVNMQTISSIADCDTACLEFTNTTVEHGGTVTYTITWPGGVAPTPTGSQFLPGDTVEVCFSPFGEYKPRLVACNECIEPSQCNTLGPSKEVTVYALKLRPTIDTIATCAGDTLGLIANAMMQPQPLIDPNVTQWIWKIQEQGCIGQVVPDGNCYIIDTIVVDGINDTLVVIDTCINMPDIAGPDTLNYIPCTRNIWVQLEVVGNCGPDSIDRTIILKAPPRLLMQDTLRACLDDPAINACVTVDQTFIPNPGLPPFKITWYDSIVSNLRIIEDTLTSEFTHCINKQELGSIRSLYDFWPEDYTTIPSRRFIVRIEDSLGCIVLDTIELILNKPVIDDLRIDDFSDATATCTPDANENQLCGIIAPNAQYVAFCPGDTIPLSFTVKGQPTDTVRWFTSATGLPPYTPTTRVFNVSPFIPYPIDSITNDTAFFIDRNQRTDFFLVMIVTDTLGCMDTAIVCMPIHEPPIITPPASICLNVPPDSLRFCIEGACVGSNYDWSNMTLGPDNNLLVSVGPPDSCRYLDYTILQNAGWTDSMIIDKTYNFAVIVTDAVTGCVDTLFQTFNFADFNPAISPDTSFCTSDPKPWNAQFTISNANVNSTYEWFNVPACVLLSPASTVPFNSATENFNFDNCPDGIYQVEVRVLDTLTGCFDTLSATVTILPPPAVTLIITPNDTLCEENSFTLTTSGAASYIWSANPSGPVFIPGANDSTFTVAPLAIGGVTTMYEIMVIGRVGECVDTLVDSIWVTPKPQITITGPSSVCADDTTTKIFATITNLNGAPLSDYTFVWNSAEVFNCTNARCDTINIRPVSNPSTYSVTVTNITTGCDTTVNVPITITPRPVANAGTDTLICFGGTATLGGSPTGSGGSGTYSYSWTPAAGLSNPTDANPTASPADTTTYCVIVTDLGTFCRDTSCVTVNVNPEIVLSLDTMPDTVCVNGANLITLTANLAAGSGTPPYTYTWTGNGIVSTNTGNVNTNTADPIITGNLPYGVTVTDASGCTQAVSIFVPVIDTANITFALTPPSICQGDQLPIDITITGFTGVINSYNWTDNGAGGAFSPSNSVQDPTYIPDPNRTGNVNITVDVQNQCGVATQTASLTINPKPVVSIASTYDTICQGRPVTLTASGAILYIWSDSLSGSPIPANPVNTITVSPAVTTTYMIIGTSNGCSDTAYYKINVLPNPTPVLNAEHSGGCYPLQVIFNYDVPAGMTVASAILDLDNGQSLTDAAGSGSFNYTYELQQGVLYPVVYNPTLTVTYSNGCRNTATVGVEVCEDFIIPNVFTPGGGDANDNFVIKGIDNESCQLTVFNRWGEKVFDSPKYANEWDGKDTNGKDLAEGVYYYVLKCDELKTWTGWVKIIR